MAGRITLKRGKAKPLLNHHPWVFSGAIESIGDSRDGQVVDVFDSDGRWLARGSFNSQSQIAVHVWTFDSAEEIDRGFFERHIAESIRRRDKAVIGQSDRHTPIAYRLINAESDGLPGLVVDRYADYLIVQFLTLGIENYKSEIVDLLKNLVAQKGIYERSDVDIRKKEGLAFAKGVLCGDEPPERLEIVENGLRFLVNVKTGHKTGFYLDQRENRSRASPYMWGEVLNAFSYSGGFGVYAGRAGATRVLNVDSSAGALDLAKENFEINGFGDKSEFAVGDAFEKLREFRDEGRRFDTIVLDPPKFVSSRGQLERGLRGYKDINLLAFQLLNPLGTLVTCSCSGLVNPDLFQKVIFGAITDARREGQIVEKLSQSADHPVSLSFPEAEYLKGLIVRAW